MSFRSITANGVYPGQELTGDDRHARLYHYTSLDSFCKIWDSGKLLFHSVRNMNDVLERRINSSSPNFATMPLLYAYSDIRARYRQISFTMDYDTYIKGCMSPAMWGYYGASGKGVCIGLDYSKIPIPLEAIQGEINYCELIAITTELPDSVQTQKDIHSFIRSNAEAEFFTKQSCWREENEFRIILLDGEYLDISQAISAVYVSSYDSEECLKVEEIVGDRVPVEFLHFIDSNGKALPVMTDTRTIREQLDNAKNSLDNVLNSFSRQAKDFYDKHCDDETFPLILGNFNI